MAWNYNEVTGEISITEKDFGVACPITIEDITITEQDQIAFYIKKPGATENIFEKTYSDIQHNKFDLVFAESERLPVGQYIYLIDWQRDGVFLDNLVDNAIFRVVAKG